MESRTRLTTFPRTVVLILGVLLVLAAMAGGYVIRYVTASSATHSATVVSSGTGASASQPDASCIWTAHGKGC